MVPIREHKHKRLTRHAVATVPVCAALPADRIAVIMIAARKKGATP